MRSINTSKAFTLIEVIVVISIISLLLVIMLPVLGRVRNEAMRFQCSSNLKSIGVGYYTYVFSNDDKFPDADVLDVSSYRVGPQYVTEDGRRECFGLACLFDENQIIEGGSDVWICPDGNNKWMRDYGVTYAFSVSQVFYEKKYPDFTSEEMREIALTWGNWQLFPGEVGVRGQPYPKFLPMNRIKFPHAYKNNSAQSMAFEGVNILLLDGSTTRGSEFYFN
ncbi:prepilin-type N-terminal cleavage/methylation domain-containing protein [Sedimentisphaera salicampi]|uniref:prepilin-type N-terminal cleavage/methylation domain-containing protein n=1 Tax=Sedimentisphaera salicampi TaxID=1941349 RepID=UPI000B9C05D2|nr:prepilin-type N-terminal cleavage/methylation domain-containing protein [Sedimentisphaera salicampi]OXU14143.1 Competence protein ComGC [Sedimentisphaera salicampi]